jgi:hypothetical protein
MPLTPSTYVTFHAIPTSIAAIVTKIIDEI